MLPAVEMRIWCRGFKLMLAASPPEGGMRPAGRALLPAGPTHLRVLPLRDGALIRETPYDRSMMFTPLHRALGEPAGPITFDMLQHAIKVGVAENDELDWKRNLPEQSKFKDSDFIKDIAAMNDHLRCGRKAEEGDRVVRKQLCDQ